MPAVFYGKAEKGHSNEAIAVYTNSGSGQVDTGQVIFTIIPSGKHDIIITQAPDAYDESITTIKVIMDGKAANIYGSHYGLDSIGILSSYNRTVANPVAADKADLYLGKKDDKFFTQALDQGYNFRDLWYTKSLFG